MHTKVPLWLALNLRQRQKCRLEPPLWLNVGKQVCTLYSVMETCSYTDELLHQMAMEKASSTFTKMASPHYMEVASMLLNK